MQIALRLLAALMFYVNKPTAKWKTRRNRKPGQTIRPALDGLSETWSELEFIESRRVTLPKC